ncbi:hypothetical protein RPMA_02485 [Tardiphaga alba]|uniref:GcrA cell cycle regulator n=1 Tax=Tardiphaga alba TaxID=340268 RepID=A0ABX8A7S2_9BRAD|nr:hypothetical protein [Tardiphaga alba]QUS37850.1 hypothetical protein RPMA_02485 [Tardiphaga alba]
MARLISSRVWTEADIARLKALALQGASLTRASAALNRRMTSVTKMARLHGVKFPGTRELKKAIRALDPNAAFSVGR